jgi:hypothetical protein
MAQFRSSAREGSFSDNQLKVPSTTDKIQREAQRQLSGMDRAQAYQKENQRIALQAQKQAQGIQENFRKAARSVSSDNNEAEAKYTKQAYERELLKQQNEAKYAIDTFGALANFSKTAFDITAGIIKENKEVQQKAINQIAFTHNYSHKDLLNAKLINSDVSNAEMQRTNIIKQYLEEGKSQEFINAFDQHLVKGGGYRNYIANSNVLRSQATINAEIIQDIVNDPKLSIEEKRKQIASAEAKMRGELAVDGEIPGQPILEKAYNPTMRRTLDRANQVLNGETRAKLETDADRDNRATIYDVAFSGGSFNAKGVMDLISNNPRPNAMNDTMEYLATLNLSEDQIEQIFKAPITKDGKVGNIRSFGYTTAIATLNAARTKARRETQEVQALEAQEKQLSAEMQVNELAQQLATDDGRVDNKDYRDISNLYYELAGAGADPKYLEGIKRQTIDAQLMPVMQDQLEEGRLNKTLSVKELDRINPPKILYDQYIGAAQRLDAIKATPQYKELGTYLEGRITNNIKDLPDIKFKDTGPQSDQFNWFVGERTKEAKKNVIDLVTGGMPIAEAMQIVGTTAANDAKEFMADKKNFDGFTLKSYEKMVDESTKAQLIAQRRVTKFKGLTRAKQKDMAEVLNAIGEAPLIAASKKLAETGNSEVLNVIGSRTGMTAYEVQEKLAEVNPNIEAIPMNPTYVEIQDNWSPKQRYAFTSDKVSNEQRLRELQQQVNQFQNRNSFQPRESFQASGERYQSNGSGVINRAGNNDVNNLAKEGANLINSLTDQDYNDLAYAISSEAALGTDDEFGVAANILTRLMVGGFGNNINEIINAPGQYEGVYSGASAKKESSVKQAIAKSLKSDAGKLKLLEFIKRLDGRAFFKGQALLGNRVPSEDPMFADNGNFYHR